VSQLPAVKPVTSAIESTLIQGDLSKLTPAECLSYYNAVCESVGLNPLTQPFRYLFLNGNKVLYAKKDATDQLRKIHGISIPKIEKDISAGILTVTAHAINAQGRQDSDVGVVSVEGLKGLDLANAIMKASTKAKRRVTLSICGLGILDETEIEDIPKEFKTADFNSDPFGKRQAALDAMTAAEMPPEPPFDDQIPEDKPAPTDEEYFGNYIIPIGKDYKGKAIKDVDQFKLDGFVKWLKNDAKTKGKELTGPAVEFVQKAEAFLSSREVKQER